MNLSLDWLENLFSYVGLWALNWATLSLFFSNTHKPTDCSAFVSDYDRSSLLGEL